MRCRDGDHRPDIRGADRNGEFFITFFPFINMQDPPKGPLSSVRRPRALIYVTNRPILICLTLFWVRFCQRFSSIMCFINRRDTLTGDFSVILPASRTKRFKSELLRGWLEEICMVLKFGNFSFCWFQNFSAFQKQFYRNLCRHGQWQYSVHSNQKNWLNMHKYVITSVRTIHIWSTSIPSILHNTIWILMSTVNF